MNKLKFILYFIDGIISFITIIIGIPFIISHVTIPPYGIGETIITLAIMFTILYFTNKTIIEKIKKASKNNEEKEVESQENAGEFKEIKENIQAENKNNRPKIAEEQKYEQENENEKRPLNKWLRNIITISVILFSAIVLIYILATYPEKLKMPYSILAILIPILVFLAIVMMILRWHQKQADLYEEYQINNKN
ncbi:MAG: hypothetical protein RXO36_04350, partial [Candidatus Nanopusillus acidilobi]